MYRAVIGCTLLAGLAALALPAQNYAPPAVQKPDETKLKTIAARMEKLDQQLGALRRKGIGDPQLADMEIYYKAADWTVRHDEFYTANTADWLLAALDAGLLRASQVGQGEAPWLSETGHTVLRAYRSGVDGSVQPYAVTLPEDYGKDPGRKWRVDVVLHGRDAGLTEIKFIHQHDTGKPAPKDQAFVKIDLFGRGNNAYRWAGESDVIEAVDNFQNVERALGRRPLLDPRRYVLRGFSMGGAGTWHLGLHRPDQWCVIGPGAGFTTTHGYIKGLPDPLPPYQEPCLRIYDAVDYAENAADVPVVAYAGSDDPQLQAARNIEARLEPLGIPMTILVSPGLKHEFPAEWQKKAEEQYAKYVDKGRPEYPSQVRFVTYTLKYPRCDWVTLLALDRHYEKASVNATRTESGFTIKTANIRALALDLPVGSRRETQAITIDEQRLDVLPYHRLATGTLHVYLLRRDGSWKAVLPERILTGLVRQPQKTTNMQGPIDDAFMGPFLCVQGTGEPWHPATEKYARENLARFQAEWDRYFRGTVAVKKDVEVTPDDLALYNLVLFGDPASNSLIAQVLDGLPLKWTKEQIALGTRPFPSATHVPVMIYPSPLNAGRYVVLNSGHTFHAADFQGTNALLYPRLGDYAVLKLAPTEKEPLAVEVADGGIFDDFWRLPTK